MSEKIKKTGLIIFKFILSIIVVIGIFIVLDIPARCVKFEEGIFVLLSILSAFTLGLIYRKEI